MSPYFAMTLSKCLFELQFLSSSGHTGKERYPTASPTAPPTGLVRLFDRRLVCLGMPAALGRALGCLQPRLRSGCS